MNSIRSQVLKLFQEHRKGLTTKEARALLPDVNLLTMGAQINHLAADRLLARVGKRLAPGGRQEIVFKFQRKPPKTNLEFSEALPEEARQAAAEINPKNYCTAFLARADYCEVLAAHPLDFKLGTTKAEMIGKADRVIAL